MLLFTVDSKEYKAFHSWGEMPLSLALKMFILCDQAPKKLLEIYKLLSDQPDDEAEREKELSEWYASVTEEERIKIFPTFYGKVIELLTDLPKDVIQHIDPSSRETFYKQYCESFVFGILHYPVDYKYQNIEQFELNGVTYFLPQTKTVLGVEKPFFDRSAIEFTEAADLELFAKAFAGGKYEVAVNIISILCRPVIVGILEPYNEEICLERAKEFQALKMDIVWEVFFCLQKHIDLFQTLIAIYSTKEVIKQNVRRQIILKTLDGTVQSLKQQEELIK